MWIYFWYDKNMQIDNKGSEQRYIEMYFDVRFWKHVYLYVI